MFCFLVALWHRDIRLLDHYWLQSSTVILLLKHRWTEAMPKTKEFAALANVLFSREKSRNADQQEAFCPCCAILVDVSISVWN